MKKQRPVRQQLIQVGRKIINQPPSFFLHIKLGLMKQYVKALDKHEACFAYLRNAFPGLSSEKLIGEIFDGPQIR